MYAMSRLRRRGEEREGRGKDGGGDISLYIRTSCGLQTYILSPCLCTVLMCHHGDEKVEEERGSPGAWQIDESERGSCRLRRHIVTHRRIMIGDRDPKAVIVCDSVR